MIGQDKLIATINSYTFMTFPQSSIFVGDYGCGKHLLVEYISNKYNVNSIDISDNMNSGIVSDIYITSTPTIYVIDIRKVKRLEQSQNIILKLLEEPPINCKIVLITESTDILLNTVQNRCHVFKFSDYTNKELSEFAIYNNIDIMSEDLYTVCNTPGKLLKLNMTGQEYNELHDISDKIISSITKASVPNILSLSTRFDFSSYQIDAFMHMMRLNILKNLTDLNITPQAFNILKRYYVETCKVSEKFRTFNVNKRQLFENYLLILKGVQ